MNVVMQLLGFVLIYAACDVARGPENQIPLFSWQKLLQIVLVTAGVLIHNHYTD
jgi:hypothetical protein